MHAQIIKFWFEDIKPSQWWVKDKHFDRQIVDRFSDLHARAIQCELAPWRQSAAGRLAEIIVLDQFSRNMYRQSPLAFASDSLALALAQEAVSIGVDVHLEVSQRAFLYMPFMHSESLLVHDRAMELFSEPGLEGNLKSEIEHRNIIHKFGRYPHRNSVLDRCSSTEELAFLKQPGSKF